MATITTTTSAPSAANWEPLVLESDIPGYPVQVSGPTQSRYNAHGHLFSSPFWSATYNVGRRFGQMNSASMEFLLRVVTGILSFLMVPIALILIPFGILLRATAVAAGKKDLTFVRPPDEAYEAAAVVLRTQNLGFIPHVSPVNGLAIPPKRAPAMLRDVKSGRDDIICLQELFDLTVINRVLREIGAGKPEIRRPVSAELNGESSVEAGRRLTEAGATYPWVLCDVDPKPYRLNSGLFVASRYPVLDPEFIRFSVASRDDILAGKGVLGCSVVLGEIGGRKCKLTLFTTHAQAGHYMRIHTYQFRAIMEFMKYYNQKFLGAEDIIVASMLMGDYNLGPVSSRPDPKTGKLQLNDEWSVMKAIFDEYGMQNYFYDKTPEGLARERNREIILQIQDLWYDEGARAWERYHVKGATKEAQDLERADRSRGNRIDIPWQMDIFALLALLRTLVTKKETEPSDTLEATVEAELKQELARQVAVGKDKKKRESADLGELNVIRIVDLVGQLTGLSDGQGGLVEKLIPGSAIEMKGYRTLFPTEVKLCDIDHVLMPKRINGRKPLVKRAHIKIVTEGVFEYTDHYGKRTTLDIDWDRLRDGREGAEATLPLRDSGAGQRVSIDDSEEVEVEGPGKERIRDHVVASSSSSSSSAASPATSLGQEIVIPIE
ncbi:uncharacterized protein ACA1_057110 [Acanthamoeba castellanii str. Neff]|uniref:Endonuclease/exonuclease/phosphatase domain-containing protein n=1 Tax=Acanthamoeba castellanii (strain ATCC 30010 / Neff) TaxID=1257118 RepID=L8GV72_ACACF|nr:uncharacterized protein ACA1_057110 [Acanthamoeba castellanii str. Neff]ELR17079.1 hypothetical protein ACA1_057110 [Acanthamoeba castellanii str. Neff]